jgi:ABC-2 type transport system permease protein
MRLFWEMALQSFRRYMTYRAATIAGLATNFFFGLFRVAVLLALLEERTEIGGYSAQDVIVYTGFTQAMLALLMIFGWWDLMISVHNGDVSSDLLKPMDFFTYWLAQDLGRAFVALLLRGVVFMALFELVYDLTYPETAVSWLIVSISIILAWLISFGFRFLINLAAFWTPNAKGIGRFGFVVSWFFSGQLMPLKFFPEWVQVIANITPFPHMLNTVVELYIGIISGPEAWLMLLIQLVWVIGMVLICQVVLKTAVRRLVILGG